MSIPSELILKHGDIVLAKLSACDAFDMGWLSCEFQTTDAFAEFMPVFEEGRQLVHRAGLHNRAEDYAALANWKNRLDKLGLSLIDPADGLALYMFTLHPISEQEVHIHWVKKVPVGEDGLI